MKLDKEMRKDMLQIARNGLLYSAAPPYKIIKFYTLSGDLLCETPFDTLDSDNSGDQVAYIFKAIDGTTDLRGSVTDTGTVFYFEIAGKTPGIVPVIEDLIHGSIGTLGSGKDMEFNKINWVSGMTIVLSNLKIFMNQGK